MERSNQPPKTECCREEGQVPEATEAAGPNDLLEAYTGELTGRKQETHPANSNFSQTGDSFPEVTDLGWRSSAQGVHFSKLR